MTLRPFDEIADQALENLEAKNSGRATRRREIVQRLSDAQATAPNGDLLNAARIEILVLEREVAALDRRLAEREAAAFMALYGSGGDQLERRVLAASDHERRALAIPDQLEALASNPGREYAGARAASSLLHDAAHRIRTLTTSNRRLAEDWKRARHDLREAEKDLLEDLDDATPASGVRTPRDEVRAFALEVARGLEGRAADHVGGSVLEKVAEVLREVVR